MPETQTGKGQPEVPALRLSLSSLAGEPEIRNEQEQTDNGEAGKPNNRRDDSPIDDADMPTRNAVLGNHLHTGPFRRGGEGLFRRHSLRGCKCVPRHANGQRRFRHCVHSADRAHARTHR